MHDAFGARLSVGTTVYYSPGGSSGAPVRAEITDFKRGQVRVVVTALPRAGAPSKGLTLGCSRWLDPAEVAVLAAPDRLQTTELTRRDLALGGYPPGVGYLPL